MFYHLLVPLADTNIAFNVFRYTSFRMAWALITALTFCYVAYPAFIRWMTQRKMQQIIRDDGPQAHLENKVGTPTMGGVPMLAGIIIASLLWCRLDVAQVGLALSVLFGYGLIGFVDDWKKVMERSADGLAGRWKIVGQLVFGAGPLLLGWKLGVVTTDLPIPFLKATALELGPLYIAVGFVMLVGASNAVNLTDGLDGLAIGPVMTSAGTYGILSYIAGHAGFAGYLLVDYMPGASELSVVCMAMVGAGLGFLWYNAYPAQIFMGDVGSLSLGGILAMLAILSKHELLLVLVGGIFVLEALSVMIQVGSFKLTKKRVFAMAPIHHHYEKQGWSEPKIIVRFWIISILLSLVALTTLKLR